MTRSPERTTAGPHETRQSSALADRAARERDVTRTPTRNAHTFHLDSPDSGTNKRKSKSPPEQSTIPSQRPRMNRGKRQGATTTLDVPNTPETPRKLGTSPDKHHRGLANGRVDEDSDPDDDLEPPSELPEAEKIADRRNLDRIERANLSDQNLLSKYLPASVHDFLLNSIPGPDDNFSPNPYLLNAIRKITESDVRIPLKPPIHFEVSEEAVLHNSGLLEKCDFDLTTFLAKHQNSTLAFGSEFRPVGQLELILGSHPKLRLLPRRPIGRHAI
jgi:hypothetical protein